MILWVSQPNLPVPLPFASRTATLNFCNSHTGKDGERFYAPIWCPDSQAKACAVCQASFTTFRRKYHCRLCGHIICKYVVVIPLSLECIADALLSPPPPSLCFVQGLFSRSSITQSTKGEGHEKERCQAQVRFIHLCCNLTTLLLLRPFFSGFVPRVVPTQVHRRRSYSALKKGRKPKQRRRRRWRAQRRTGKRRKEDQCETMCSVAKGTVMYKKAVLHHYPLQKHKRIFVYSTRTGNATNRVWAEACEQGCVKHQSINHLYRPILYHRHHHYHP